MAVETGTKVMPFSSIPVKSPDASPMDFCGFGFWKGGFPQGDLGPFRDLEGVQGGVVGYFWCSTALEPSTMEVAMQALVRARGRHIEHKRWGRHGISWCGRPYKTGNLNWFNPPYSWIHVQYQSPDPKLTGSMVLCNRLNHLVEA